ncbi:class I SAM-dependent methyltransferase [Sphaerisporangium sp. NPDC051017]|uniref:O-methyltransferase n=1 Tax=Sphaerisporangium sp. NPDC051017 TaxID=3154636 RepID=UPI003416DA4F
MDTDHPPLVAEATARARAQAFPYSCDPVTGRLLAVLAARVPPSGHVLEIGTGLGVGTAWITTGLLPRTDVTVITVEQDAARSARAAEGDWPTFVHFHIGEVPPLGLGPFDLIFADAAAGKHEGLEATIAALAPRGTLVVDDMRPMPDWPADFAERQHGVRRALFAHADLVAAELSDGSGVILATRRG